MKLYRQQWQALEQPYKVLSLLLLLMPIGIIFGRALAFACMLSFAAVALYHLATRKITWQMLDPVAKSALILGLILLFIATPFASMSVTRSLKLSLLFLVFPLFYITATMICTRHRAVLYPALAATFLLLIGMVFDGIIQRIAGVDLGGSWAMDTTGRLTGMLSHPNYTATNASFLFIVLAAWVPFLRGRFYVWMCALVLTTTGIGIFSGDRSATLLLITALFAGTALAAFSYPRMRMPALLMGAVVGVLMFVASTHSVYLQSRIGHFQDQMGDFANSLYGQLYQAAFLLWIDSPFTGVGAGNFRFACPSLRYEHMLDCNLHPHNYLLEFLAEGGVFACIAWAFVIGGFARLCEYAYREGAAARRIAIVGVMIAIYHFFPFIGSQSVFSTWRAALVWFTLAMWVAAWRTETARR